MEMRDKLKLMANELEALIAIMQSAGISAKQLIADLHAIYAALRETP